jgi:hypothetical protein
MVFPLCLVTPAPYAILRYFEKNSSKIKGTTFSRVRPSPEVPAGRGLVDLLVADFRGLEPAGSFLGRPSVAHRSLGPMSPYRAFRRSFVPGSRAPHGVARGLGGPGSPVFQAPELVGESQATLERAVTLHPGKPFLLRMIGNGSRPVWVTPGVLRYRII